MPNRAAPQIGAILIAEGLITAQQLEQALQIQHETAPPVQLGQILLSLGHITPSDLTNALQLQQELKGYLAGSPEGETGRPLHTLVLHEPQGPYLDIILRGLGLEVRWCNDWIELKSRWGREQPDLVLIDPRLMGGASTLHEDSATPVWVLPLQGSSSNPGILAPWAVTALSRVIHNLHAQRGTLRPDHLPRETAWGASGSAYRLTRPATSR